MRPATRVLKLRRAHLPSRRDRGNADRARCCRRCSPGSGRAHATPWSARHGGRHDPSTSGASRAGDFRAAVLRGQWPCTCLSSDDQRTVISLPDNSRMRAGNRDCASVEQAPRGDAPVRRVGRRCRAYRGDGAGTERARPRGSARQGRQRMIPRRPVQPTHCARMAFASSRSLASRASRDSPRRWCSAASNCAPRMAPLLATKLAASSRGTARRSLSSLPELEWARAAGSRAATWWTNWPRCRRSWRRRRPARQPADARGEQLVRNASSGFPG